MFKIVNQVWKMLISLKFAVSVMVALTISLITATLVESYFDTKTAQYYVYQSWFFYLILTLFGALILSVALSRLPWKKKHIPFLMAHAGILLILTGSGITYFFGIDGSVFLSEGVPNSTVELDQPILFFKKTNASQTINFPWMPPSVAENFKGKSFPDFNVKVDRVISDAVPHFQFLEASKTTTEKTGAAIQIKVTAFAREGAPEFWLWSGESAWSNQKLGLARFLIHDENIQLPPREAGEARVEFITSRTGTLRYQMENLRGEKITGNVKFTSNEPVTIDARSLMPIQIQVKKFIPQATNQTEFVAARVPSENPFSAVFVSLIGDPSSHSWLGLGDQVDLTDQKGEILSVGFLRRQVSLPFLLHFKEFEMKHNPGTMVPSAYASFVQVGQDPTIHKIEMNEPLVVQQYTFYQTSFIPAPRVTTTILSVNYDPGRSMKYGGSLLLVLGAILLYLSKTLQKKKVAIP